MSRGKPGRKGPQDFTMFDTCFVTFGCGGSTVLATLVGVVSLATWVIRTHRTKS